MIAVIIYVVTKTCGCAFPETGVIPCKSTIIISTHGLSTKNRNLLGPRLPERLGGLSDRDLIRGTNPGPGGRLWLKCGWGSLRNCMMRACLGSFSPHCTSLSRNIKSTKAPQSGANLMALCVIFKVRLAYGAS